MRDLTAAAGITRYIALHDGVIAGGASFRMAGNIAQLTGAATAPAYRRRGIQSALLSARLADAAAAGCDVAVTSTKSSTRAPTRRRPPNGGGPKTASADDATRRPAAVPAATQRSGKITLPSSASPNPGLCAISHVCPSGSRKTPAYPP